VFVFWILKALLFLGRTRRGRKLLFAGGLMVVELARREQAQKLYAKARELRRRRLS
jgi:hypothetical protein